MTPSAGTALAAFFDERLVVAPIGLDDYSDVRHLHATAVRSQALDVLTEVEVAAFTHLVNSPQYVDMLMGEEIYGGRIDGELVGTASWHGGGDNGTSARIGWVFVRHPRFGIGRRLVGEVEARAQQCGFSQLAVSATANAVPFFERLGYRVVSKGARTIAPGCALPVAFLRKFLLRPLHTPLA